MPEGLQKDAELEGHTGGREYRKEGKRHRKGMAAFEIREDELEAKETEIEKEKEVINI